MKISAGIKKEEKIMKNTILKTIGGAALAIFALAMLTQIPMSAQDIITEEKSDRLPEKNSSQMFDISRDLEGSWSSQATFRNCRTGAAVSPSFSAMTTFMQGGTMQEFGVASGLFRGPGHGVWRYEGGLNYSSSFQFFRFNTDGTYSERVVVRQQIEFRPGNSYIATSRIEFYDTTGNLLRRGCATGTGTRFE